MSTKQGKNLTIDQVNDGIYSMAIGAETDLQISREEAFDLFERASDTQFQTLGGGEYLNWENMEEGKYVFIFTGTTSWVDNSPMGAGKTVTAVKLEDREGKEWICAAGVLVQALILITQLPCLIRVEYKGKKKSRSGNNFFNLVVQVGRGSITPLKANENNDFQM